MPCAPSGTTFLNRSKAQKFKALYGEMLKHVAGKPLKNAFGPSSRTIAFTTWVMVFMFGSIDSRSRMISSGYVTSVAVHAAAAPDASRPGTDKTPVSLFASCVL